MRWNEQNNQQILTLPRVLCGYPPDPLRVAGPWGKEGKLKPIRNCKAKKKCWKRGRVTKNLGQVK